MNRILLFGNKGQLGWELQRSLARLGEVVALGSRELDLAQADAVREAVRRQRPRLIVNAAAYTAVDRAESEPERALAVNGTAPAVMAEQAAALGAAIVHFSTDYVFDGAKGLPYSEGDAPHPLNAYGRSKLAGERAVEEVGGGYLVLRTSWVYSLRRESFVTKVLEWARSRRVLRIVDDQIGSPTWCRRLAEQTTAALANGMADPRAFLERRAGVYHLAGKGAVSRFDWAREILRVDPYPEEQLVEELLPARSEEFPAPAQRPRYSALDCTRAEGVLGVPLVDWREDLSLAIRERAGAPTVEILNPSTT
jgi:dTDP-4-dehydrorhamnose reductase